MKNLFKFLVYLSALLIGNVVLGGLTATAILYTLSYTLDFPLFENVYLVSGFNIVFIAFYGCVSIYHINYSKK